MATENPSFEWYLLQEYIGIVHGGIVSSWRVYEMDGNLP